MEVGTYIKAVVQDVKAARGDILDIDLSTVISDLRMFSVLRPVEPHLLKMHAKSSYQQFQRS